MEMLKAITYGILVFVFTASIGLEIDLPMEQSLRGGACMGFFFFILVLSKDKHKHQDPTNHEPA